MYNIQALPGPSSADSEAFGISSSGDVAGVAYPLDADGYLHIAGAVWKGGSLDFVLPLLSESLLYGVNDSDVAAGVRAILNSATEIAVQAGSGGALSDLASAVGTGSIATSINNSGQLCGWGLNDLRGFIYDTASSAVTSWINPLAGSRRCVATSINDRGEVAGLSDQRGFFFSAGSTKDLGAMAFVADVNHSGVVCGSLGKPSPENFQAAICDARQTSPTWVELPLPPGFVGSHGEGINDSGDVVGTCWSPQSYDGPQSAYIFSGGVSIDLNASISAPGWHLEFANKINNKGQICGRGTLYGQQMAFLLTPQHQWGSVLSLPELVATLFGGVTRDGGGWGFIGGYRFPIGPWGPWMEIQPAKRDALTALAIDEIAMFITDRGTRETVRRALVEAAKGRLDQLAHSVSEGRGTIGGNARVQGRARPLQHGKSTDALRRFGSQ